MNIDPILASDIRTAARLMRDLDDRRPEAIATLKALFPHTGKAYIVGVTGNPGQCNYVASKAGMIGWSKAMAAEIASRNITVNCVAPGFIATAMTEVLTDDQKAKINSTIPAGKMGSSEDIAAAVAYLASEEAGYVTGSTIHVNGGMAMI